MYKISGHSGTRIAPVAHEFTKPTHAWRFAGEHLTAIPDVMHPPDPAVIRAIHEFEPEAVFLFCRSAYISPAGSEHIFGRHVIAISPRDRKAHHQVVRVLQPTLKPSPRYPLVLDSIWQDRSESLIPDLSVYGYKPIDWQFYYEARKAWVETKKNPVETSERDAAADYANHLQATQEAKDKVDAEADYRFDHATNKGRTIRDEILSITHEDWRNLGRSQAYEAKPMVHVRTKGNA